MRLRHLVSELKTTVNPPCNSTGYEVTDTHQGVLTSSVMLCVLWTERRHNLPLLCDHGDQFSCSWSLAAFPNNVFATKTGVMDSLWLGRTKFTSFSWVLSRAATKDYLVID